MKIDGGAFSAALSPAFQRDRTCFASGASGLFRSQDTGSTWQLAVEAKEPDERLSVLALSLSPDYENDGTLFAGMQGGVLRSWDGGGSWAATVFPPPMPTVSALAISPVFPKDSILFVGTSEDGVFRTSDRGLTFTSWNFGLLDLRIYGLLVSPAFEVDETVFAATESGIFKSKNGGRSWREVDFPASAAPVLSLAISPNFADDGMLYGGTESSGLFKSLDGGRTWMSIGDERLSGSINVITVSPQFLNESYLFVATTQHIFFSKDKGVEWQEWAQVPGVMALSAPQGVEGETGVLVGTATGGVGWAMHKSADLRSNITSIAT